MMRGRKPNPNRPRTKAGHRPMIEPADATPAIVATGTDVLEPPDDLSPPARDVWRVFVSELEARQTLAVADLPALRELCRLLVLADRYGRRLEAMRDRDLGGAAAKRLRTAHIQTVGAARPLLELFGLTPVGRIRLGLGRAKGATLAAQLEDAYTRRGGR